MIAEHKKTDSFSYSFTSPRSKEEIFSLLMDIEKWWSGIFEETISGESRKINDEFSFVAGGGMHDTRQRLIEIIPNQKLVWEVTESNLTFLKKTDEWAGTKLRFDLVSEGDKTQVVFTHEGLVSKFECYENCTGGWTQYMDKLKKKLNA